MLDLYLICPILTLQLRDFPKAFTQSFEREIISILQRLSFRWNVGCLYYPIAIYMGNFQSCCIAYFHHFRPLHARYTAPSTLHSFSMTFLRGEFHSSCLFPRNYCRTYIWEDDFPMATIFNSSYLESTVIYHTHFNSFHLLQPQVSTKISYINPQHWVTLVSCSLWTLFANEQRQPL